MTFYGKERNMTTLTDRQYLEDRWTDDIPESDDLYLVTFLATWTGWRGNGKEFRGISLVECSVDEDHHVTWYTKDIEQRFPGSQVEIIAWMPLPEVAE